MGDDDPDAEARLLAATIRDSGARGIALRTKRAEHRFRQIRLQAALAAAAACVFTRQPPGALPLVLCGDFNIAPGDHDVHDPVGWRDTVICHGEARTALEKVMALGFVDTLRKIHPDKTVYTYWDYRGLSFPKTSGCASTMFLRRQPWLSAVSTCWSTGRREKATNLRPRPAAGPLPPHSVDRQPE